MGTNYIGYNEDGRKYYGVRKMCEHVSYGCCSSGKGKICEDKWNSPLNKENDMQCPNCGGTRSYDDAFDAYYCEKCDYWLEKICPDKECEFCKYRPKYPSSETHDVEVKVTYGDVVNQILKEGYSTILIPTHCYVVGIDHPESRNYEIYNSGEKLNDVFAVIRMGIPLDDIKSKRKEITNWKKELGL